MTLIGDQEFITIIIHIRCIIIKDLGLQEIMGIEEVLRWEQNQLDHNQQEQKLPQLDHNENIDLKHLQLDHKVVDEEHHQEDEVNKLSHPLRWVFLLLSIYHYEIHYNRK